MAIAFLVILPFFFLGNPSGHDFEFHVNSWMEVLQQWRQGIVYPRWAAWAHYGYGEARFVFYPPLSWMLGAALGALLPWRAVPGAFVWLALTLSGCSMFLLAQRWLPRRDALFAAALYAANPYYLVIVYWRSAFAELLAGALLPLLLLCVLRAEQEGRKAIAPLSLIVAAAWLTNAPAAVMVTYSLALLAVVVALARRSPRVLLWAGLAVLLGMGLAAFYVFPAAYEQKWVNISEVLAPGVRPQDNFLFTLINDPDHNRFNLLVSLVAAAEMVLLAGAVGLLRMSRLNSEDRVYSPEGKALRVALYAWAAAATLLMFSGTFLAWRYLPQLRFLQLPWRWLLCLNVAFAILISMAWRRWLPRLLLCCLMLVVIVLVWQRVQPPWWDTAADIDEMRANIAKGVGHEGTDEYVPAGVDPYEIKQDAPRVTLEGDGEARINIQQWDPEAKSFSADVTAPGKLVLRLFDYPAWKAEVNGHPVAAETREITGQMMIPVTAGKNRVQLTFIRTWDRTAGGVISMLAIVVLLAGFLIRRTKPSDRNWSLARLYSVSSVSSVV
ncbi:MAG TPA: 6-pyruvoyl-tetrahydropterin synthase-related protein [Terriglobales bacterium]|jgi:hypothetical protein|nr:6-pyruvoyl-tetrahydropterin synthase-related protein [Terriglobales bacterium]